MRASSSARVLAVLAAAGVASARLPAGLLASEAFRTLAERSAAVAPRLRALAAGPDDGEPQQVHLSLTGAPGEMRVMWVTFNHSAASAPQAVWLAGGGGGAGGAAAAVTTTYSAGLFGWDGFIHSAVMTGLVPGVVTYAVGDSASGLFSPQATFEAPEPPTAGASSFVAMLADAGTIMPLGWEVSDALARQHLQGPRRFDLVTIAGDLSYASVTPPNGEVEWSWDAWFLQIEPYAATAPMMMTVGNHEECPGTITNATGTYPIGFAAFTARVGMPANGFSNLWFSYTHRNVAYISVSSEHPHGPNDPQHLWAEAALAAVDRSVTPWVVFTQHRPLLSSDASEPQLPGSGDFILAWEPLLLKYKVDVVVVGHQHMYERTGALVNGTIVTPCINGTYTNPGGPIYLVIGTSGADMDFTYVEPQPAWSLVRLSEYSYLTMLATAGTSLQFELVDVNGIAHDSFAIVRS